MHEVIVDGYTYPVGDSTRPGKYMRMPLERINTGDQFEILKPITCWLENEVTKEVPIGTIFTVVKKTTEMHREDQCRYSVYMRSDTLDADIAEMSWSLLALNTDLITDGIRKL